MEASEKQTLSISFGCGKVKMIIEASLLFLTFNLEKRKSGCEENCCWKLTDFVWNCVILEWEDANEVMYANYPLLWILKSIGDWMEPFDIYSTVLVGISQTISRRFHMKFTWEIGTEPLQQYFYSQVCQVFQRNIIIDFENCWGVKKKSTGSLSLCQVPNFIH